MKIEPVRGLPSILDRKDVDAVHIATPDHWHCQMLIDAIAAGKDVYLEKPLSNTVERAVEALSAYKSSNRVVQFGTQQRSGAHFQEAAKIVQEGQLGKITHAVIQFPGNGYGTAPGTGSTCPAGTELGAVSGPRTRDVRSSRAGCAGADGGTTAVVSSPTGASISPTWRCGTSIRSGSGPLLTSGTAQYVNFVNPERDQSPDAFSVSWQYPSFVMTFTNAVVQDWEFGRQGNYFFGPGGSLLIHRAGYEVRPAGGGGGGRGRGGAAARAAAGRGPASTQAASAPPPPIQPRRVPWRDSDGSDSNSATIAHGRNFLDCVKSRGKPVSDLEIGFYASLPCLLAVKAVRDSRSFKWDDAAKKAVAV